MRSVVARAGHPDEMKVAVDDHRLGGGRGTDQAQSRRCLAFVHLATGGQIVIFAMLHERFVEHAAIRQQAAHHEAVHDGSGAIGKPDGTGLCHHAELCHGLALQSACRGAVQEQACPVDAGGAKAQGIDHAGIINHRLGIGQGNNTGDAA